MMKATVYNMQGKEAGGVELPEELFNVPWNADLVHQVVTAMQANARLPVAHTKDRGEVRGGGKKPWRQKGTGRARHGSTRSPIWKGGGVTHGPRADKSYVQKANRKARAKALLVTLSRKYKDGEVVFVDSLAMSEPKTKEAKAFLSALGKHFDGMEKGKNAVLIALPRRSSTVQKSFRNFGNVTVEELRNLNPVLVLSSRYLFITEPEAALKIIAGKKVTKNK